MTVGTAGYSRPLTASGVDITCDITGIHLEGGVRAEAIAGIAFCTRAHEREKERETQHRCCNTVISRVQYTSTSRKLNVIVVADRRSGATGDSRE